jgi:hypothetical protein
VTSDLSGSTLNSYPPPATRDEDLPLHEDVRWLAAALGQVIRRLEGESLIQIGMLRRKRQAHLSGSDGDAVDAVLATTLSGIAQGRAIRVEVAPSRRSPACTVRQMSGVSAPSSRA